MKQIAITHSAPSGDYADKVMYSVVLTDESGNERALREFGSYKSAQEYAEKAAEREDAEITFG